MTQDEKQCWKLGAIYRVLRQKKINPNKARGLIVDRTKLKTFEADRLVSLWVTSYPVKQAWGLV